MTKILICSRVPDFSGHGGELILCPLATAAQDKLLAMDPREITYEMVARKLGEIVLSRGKKGVDRQDQVDMLAYLATVARGPAQKVRMAPLPLLLVTCPVLVCTCQPGRVLLEAPDQNEGHAGSDSSVRCAQPVALFGEQPFIITPGFMISSSC